MAIVLMCPECGTKYKVSDDAMGKKFPCRECGEQIIVSRSQDGGDVDEYGEPIDEPDEYGEPIDEPDEYGEEEPNRSKRRNHIDEDDYGTPKARKKRRSKKAEAEPENFIERIGIWNLVSIIAVATLFLFALIGLAVPKLGVGIAWIGIGLSFVLLTAAIIWIYTIAFLADTRDFKIFVRCILIPFYVIIFIKDEIDATWKALLLGVAAGILLFISFAYKNFL